MNVNFMEKLCEFERSECSRWDDAKTASNNIPKVEIILLWHHLLSWNCNSNAIINNNCWYDFVRMKYGRRMSAWNGHRPHFKLRRPPRKRVVHHMSFLFDENWNLSVRERACEYTIPICLPAPAAPIATEHRFKSYFSYLQGKCIRLRHVQCRISFWFGYMRLCVQFQYAPIHICTKSTCASLFT